MDLLFGAAPDTANQGVTALCHALVHGLAARGIGPVTVVDHGRTLRRERWAIGSGEIPVERLGISATRRVWRGDCLATVALATRLGGAGNPRAEAIRTARTVLDASGGDSFTDLYGPRRFEAITLPKELAVAAGRRLVLLPQTIGPFRDAARRRRAARVLAAAEAVFTRDGRSLSALRELLGGAFDPARHRAGIDMAVLLPPRSPAALLPPEVSAWLAGAPGPVAGLNVSGLLWNEAAAARARFGLAADYRATAEAIARAILADGDARLLLVPHVTVAEDHPEADARACRDLAARLAADFPGRVLTLPNGLTAGELKSVIGRLDWFCGARMHATIAALSSAVPVLGLAYSDKIEGVFEACGLTGAVADLRALTAAEVAEVAADSIALRAGAARRLAAGAPALAARAEAQMDTIAAIVAGTAAGAVAAAA